MTIPSPTRRLSYTAVGACCVLAQILTACSDVAEEQSATTSTITSGPHEQPTSQRPPSPSPPTTTAVPPPPEQAVLTVGDLIGGGWKPVSDISPEGSGEQISTQPECLTQSSNLSVGATGHAGAAWDFDQAAEVEWIFSNAYTYADPAAASAAMTRHREVASGCVSWQSGPGTYTYSEEQELFEVAVGQEAVARHERTRSMRYPELIVVSMYSISARIGSTVIEVAYRPGSLLDHTTGRTRTEELARRAVAKISS